LVAPKIASVSVPQGKSIQQSDNFLAAKHNQLSRLDSVEDLVLDETKLSARDRQAIEHHILNIRAATARALWLKEIYVCPSLLDDFVLGTAKQGGIGIAARVLNNLTTAGAETPGFVLYPLTSFGMKMPGLFQSDPALKDFTVFRTAGFAASTQVNSVKAGYHRLTEMARALGIRGKIDLWDIEHFAHSATWLGRNPLLLVRLTSHTGDMYENQFVYKLKLRSAASALLMLHALSLETEGPNDKFRSSLHVNNFQTLDIHHYLIGEGLPTGNISTRRVPMNVSPLDLARLSDVAATISTEAMATSRMKRFETQIVVALKTVERGYFQHVNLTSKSKAQARLYKRLVTSLDWFRQSFGSHSNESEAVVALAVAFETLLTDSYQPGVADRIIRRVGICLKGFPGVDEYKRSVLEVYYARGSIVHTGELGQTANVTKAQGAFARCFCSIASRLASWTPTANDPMMNLLGDT
jgi:hypothetical protein